VLGGLVQKGLAATRPGSVVKYAATEPALAIERLVGARRNEFRGLELGAAATVRALTAGFVAGASIRIRSSTSRFSAILAAINARLTSSRHRSSAHPDLHQAPYAKPPQENIEGLEVVRKPRGAEHYEFSVSTIRVAGRSPIHRSKASRPASFPTTAQAGHHRRDHRDVRMQDRIAASTWSSHDGRRASVTGHLLKTAFDAYWAQGLTFDSRCAAGRAGYASAVTGRAA